MGLQEDKGYAERLLQMKPLNKLLQRNVTTIECEDCGFYCNRGVFSHEAVDAFGEEEGRELLCFECSGCGAQLIARRET